ncbi:response regulator transcription factor [Cohnella nanjingensis]|uniref:Response regulator transcription factor n=1 Tax=Cohnella nanjingensis TaxID=1387779 RepID=A0A7X0RLZ7_9BACL|nr:response regulator transcription factor [Cohnella nanjingensis]MBB6669987.1 response regulator transcription factor [Cohnella nanjingensis]
MIVEDETKMRKLLVDFFTHEGGYRLLEASNGRVALDLFAKNEVDLILLDIMMPFVDGLTVCRSVRARSNAMIVLLTAKSEEEDKLVGYELGADDYITKPFSLKVLSAKMKVLFKRQGIGAAKDESSDGWVRTGGLELNELSREVRADGGRLELSPKEFELLLYLYKHRNIALAREKMLEQIWGFDYEGDIRTVDTHIKRLRHKLGKQAGQIATVIGHGYKFQVKP